MKLSRCVEYNWSQIQSHQSRKSWQEDRLVCVCKCGCVYTCIQFRVGVRKLTLSLYSWHSIHQVGVKVVRLVIAWRPSAVTVLGQWSVEFNIALGGVAPKEGGRTGTTAVALRCVVLRCVHLVRCASFISLVSVSASFNSLDAFGATATARATDWLNAIDVALGAECCATFLLPFVYVRTFPCALPCPLLLVVRSFFPPAARLTLFRNSFSIYLA